jgi:hypothetical protein
MNNFGVMFKMADRKSTTLKFGVIFVNYSFQFDKMAENGVRIHVYSVILIISATQLYVCIFITQFLHHKTGKKSN